MWPLRVALGPRSPDQLVAQSGHGTVASSPNPTPPMASAVWQGFLEEGEPSQGLENWGEVDQAKSSRGGARGAGAQVSKGRTLDGGHNVSTLWRRLAEAGISGWPSGQC